MVLKLRTVPGMKDYYTATKTTHSVPIPYLGHQLLIRSLPVHRCATYALALDLAAGFLGLQVAGTDVRCTTRALSEGVPNGADRLATLGRLAGFVGYVALLDLGVLVV